MSSSVRKVFDPSRLDESCRRLVKRRATEIRALVRKTAEGIIAIGQKLAEVKKRLPHGQWGPWLRDSFEMTDDMARRFINVAERFAGKPQIAEFALPALYLLAEPSTPQTAVDEAIGRADAGEKITHTGAVRILKTHNPPIKCAVDINQPETDHPPQETRFTTTYITLGPVETRPYFTEPGEETHNSFAFDWLRRVIEDCNRIQEHLHGLGSVLAKAQRADWLDVQHHLLPQLKWVSETIAQYQLRFEKALES